MAQLDHMDTEDAPSMVEVLIGVSIAIPVSLVLGVAVAASKVFQHRAPQSLGIGANVSGREHRFNAQVSESSVTDSLVSLDNVLRAKSPAGPSPVPSPSSGVVADAETSEKVTSNRT